LIARDPTNLVERRLSRWNLLLAFLAIPLAIGGIAGLVDGVASTAASRFGGSGPSWPAILLLTPSLGALLATIPLLFAAGPAFAIGGRRPESLLAISAAMLLTLPAAFFLARSFYKRLPWSAAEAGAVVLLFLILTLFFLVVARLLSKWIEPNALKVSAALARMAPLLLLLLAPALVRGIPAAWNEMAGHFRGTNPSNPRSATTPASSAQTNLLLLTIDTIRADCFGVTGDPAARTPHLDRFARRSIQFPVCVAPSPWTLPSLASLLTGKHPGEHKVLEALTAPPDSIPSLAEIFARHGRRTAAFVANPWLATGTLARGFESFDVAERLECYREISATRLYRSLSKSLLRARRLDEGEAVTDRGLRWIESASRRDAPWFLWLHYFDPHLPNWPRFPFDRLTGPAPRNVDPAITVEQIRAADFTGGEDGRREIEQLYTGEVAATDRAIGRALRHLDSWDLFGRTAVVISGDHGEEFWDHGEYGHGHAMYDEVIRVPLFLSAPPQSNGFVAFQTARLVDLAPTLLSLSGVPYAPGDFAGNALLAPEAIAGSEAYGEGTLYGPEKKFLRSETFKIVFTPPADSASAFDLQIFDLSLDPAERNDLAPRNSELADKLFPRLAAWIERVGSSRRTSSNQIPGEVDPAVLEQLKALGYIQ
jgi:arylsulfatase A-like enzyme